MLWLHIIFYDGESIFYLFLFIRRMLANLSKETAIKKGIRVVEPFKYNAIVWVASNAISNARFLHAEPPKLADDKKIIVLRALTSVNLM